MLTALYDRRRRVSTKALKCLTKLVREPVDFFGPDIIPLAHQNGTGAVTLLDVAIECAAHHLDLCVEVDFNPAIEFMIAALERSGEDLSFEALKHIFRALHFCCSFHASKGQGALRMSPAWVQEASNITVSFLRREHIGFGGFHRLATVLVGEAGNFDLPPPPPPMRPLKAAVKAPDGASSADGAGVLTSALSMIWGGAGTGTPDTEGGPRKMVVPVRRRKALEDTPQAIVASLITELLDDRLVYLTPPLSHRDRSP